MATVSLQYPSARVPALLALTPAPPPYTRQIPAVATYPTNDNLRVTLQDLTATAHDFTAQNALSEEIGRLSIAALTIDQAFHDVGRKLAEATREQHRCVDLYQTCSDLEAQWSQHHRTYQQLLWRSRQAAGEARGAVDEFCEIILPSLRDPAVALGGKQEILREQMEELRDRSKTSEGLSQEFVDFGRTLDTYISDFSQIVEGIGLLDQNEKVRILVNRLRPAKHTMDTICEEVKQLAWKFTGDVVMTGVAILLAVVAPMWWARLAEAVVAGMDGYCAKDSCVQLWDGLRRREGKYPILRYCSTFLRMVSQVATREYNIIKSEYDAEQGRLNQMVKLESTLHDSRPVVHDVTTKLGAFATVWAAITADLRSIEVALSFSNPSSQLFIRRIERLERLYGYLSQALRHYQVTVRLPESQSAD
ncbi:hypothetical protein HYDPIDRAFT_26521 [Hydnomerulius pinastri MD-312]|nr:hypothetical protein HYDPIDRAFT_26521 [Hydnomerulius pinastri MD-312]